MNNELDKIHVIERESLNEEFYFQSLTQQAYKKGLLSEGDIERLQYECLNLLAYKTERYNAGDSSSIRVEKAQSIMASILFTIGLWLKTYPGPDDAVSALLSEPVEELYQKGRKRINKLLRSTKALHAKLLHELIETPNVFYASTLVDGILGFFKLYDPDYAAQEIHIMADYPLFNPIPRLAGIEFIKAYVTGAYYENQFCGRFSAEYIHNVMRSGVKSYEGLGYEELLVNIYGHVLAAELKGRTLAELISRFQCSDGLARYIKDSMRQKIDFFSGP